jgi:colanic acid/amylovoran biosynthesis protein
MSIIDKSLPVVHVDKFLPAAEVKALIGNCSMAISSRYHALIAALSQGIPAAAIGWAHKYNELMAELDLSSGLISLSKGTEEILSDIDSMIRQLPELRTALPPKVEIMKESGRRAVDSVISAIRDRLEA